MMRAVPSASTAQKFEQQKAEARIAWEKYLQQRDLDERLEMHRRLALAGGVVLREFQ